MEKLLKNNKPNQKKIANLENFLLAIIKQSCEMKFVIFL